ncbi:MFS transporter [Burkholderia multivorans]|uniref:MFS transporter n=1 Tax=Burkholderia multivorans TaxID=87883 RepID=UPI00201A2185|nr:MFS transporter [Burkholderia multivorans]MCO1368658.1 MFS transporter [Burkholderia multivorans]MCO1380549.1 MFS transporter [Burkholderia multivorans]MDN8032086.1 MFS transporter [Burkholderia multivorans]UQP22024.1 MFS transporter [Burkholderia multivorans]UQP91528.1 MFS transporter [Burkholderia multivorans]
MTSHNTPAASSSPNTIDVQSFIDGRKMSFYQLSVIAICVAVLVLDGFDAVMIAYVAPSLAGILHLAPKELGPLFAAGLGGLTVGAFLCGPLADKVGRKRVLIASVAIFGGFTLLSSIFDSLSLLTTLRFLAGLGLGGAGPSAMALIAEMCPRDRRSSQLAWLGCGIPLGGGLAGFVAARMIPVYGWPSMFVIGGILPLLLLIAIAIRVPDSVRFLLLHHAGQSKVRRVMSKIAPEQDFSSVAFSSRNEKESRAVVLNLFKDGLASSTLLLWLASFCTLMVVYFLTNWLPILLHSTKHSLGETSILLSLFLIGSPFGSLTVGFLMDRYSRHICMVVSALIAAVCLVVIGNVVSDLLPAAVVSMAVGASCGACVTGSSILASFLYPTAVRATGIGWTAGCGRLGSVFGTMSGSVLLATGMAVPSLLKVASIPCFLASASFFALMLAARKQPDNLMSISAKSSA